jgi:hypothetical protein
LQFCYGKYNNGLEKPTFHPLGDFFKVNLSPARTSFKKIAKWVKSGFFMAQEPFSKKKPKISQTKYQINDINSYSDWYEGAINSRQSDLADIAVLLWKIGKTHFSPTWRFF